MSTPLGIGNNNKAQYANPQTPSNITHKASGQEGSPHTNSTSTFSSAFDCSGPSTDIVIFLTVRTAVRKLERLVLNMPILGVVIVKCGHLILAPFTAIMTMLVERSLTKDLMKDLTKWNSEAPPEEKEARASVLNATKEACQKRARREIDLSKSDFTSLPLEMLRTMPRLSAITLSPKTVENLRSAGIPDSWRLECHEQTGKPGCPASYIMPTLAKRIA